ncbi:polyphosphate kinase 2 family protein [Bizionia argentinensis JUB59]|uniref:Polyphosphate kinase 2 family protein n=1 Tax=Bizionia argentinensis JUB59 TaxID=1046627 RepID=G2EF33_9FLAO|nr:PPK2 family polyphosphate kinase [Bizionia argentinensis]EGV42925.1 polyphosphate kinase 2 family protein [Bizionia argentinensis JUB59]
MKSIKPEDFRVSRNVDIENIETTYDLGIKKSQVKDELQEVCKDLAKIQNAMYAHGKYAVLICIQGMDTAGKDSMIREVFKELNARGVIVHSFKTPTDLELKHDYLWRHYVALPARGKFGVFNRTHYENVLVTRVHPKYILKENLPNVQSLEDINDAFWDRRFEQINNFEKHIAENGTIIFKFFLHISKEEQKNRLLRRLDKPDKNWKFSPGDLEERKLWDSYQGYYQNAISRTTKAHAPWYAIPSDDKPTARYIVAKILLDTLKEYKDIREPELDDAFKMNLDDYRKQLESE